MDNGTYYLPSCDDEPQTLFWRNGSIFTLNCIGITSDRGNYTLPPDPINRGICDEGQVCFWKRNITSSTSCSTDSRRKRFAAFGDLEGKQTNTTADDLQKIANTLADLIPTNGGSSPSGSGKTLTEFSCEAEGQFKQLGWSFFNIGLKQENIIQLGLDVIKGIFSGIFSSSDPLVTKVQNWIDTVDSSFSDVDCVLNCSSSSSPFGGSSICRSLARHGDLHRSMNVVTSVKNVANTNLILAIIQSVLLNVISSYREHVFDYVGNWGSLITGFQQAHRLCNTQWDFEHLNEPNNQEK